MARAPAASEKTRNSQNILPVNESSSTCNNVAPASQGMSLIQVEPHGESGRTGVNPLIMLQVCMKSASYVSSAVNLLWPVVPAALAVRYTRENLHLLIFILSYIAMVPCANLVGFAGQELAHKLPHVYGVIIEVTLGSVVEIVMFNVLLTRELYVVIKAAILGSILATLLLCMGMVFFIGGLRQQHQEFDAGISEAGSGVLLMAGLALVVPVAFRTSLAGHLDERALKATSLQISRMAAVILVIAYVAYAFYQISSHHGLFESIFKADERKDRDGHRDHVKRKLTLLESILVIMVSIALVTVLAITLVDEIPYVVAERGISDPFMGLILVPLVEKVAEHLTAYDEAWDNQMNFALAHVLGSTIQTAMFNGPLVVLVGWGLHKNMDLIFEVFEIIVLLLSIIVFGNFLRDQRSTWLEGFLCIAAYVTIAVAAYYYPNPTGEGTAHATVPGSSGGGGGGGGGGH